LSIMWAVWVLGQRIVGRIDMPMGPFAPGYFGPRAQPGYFNALCFYTVFTAPVVEELAFRGWMQSGLRDRFGTAIAIVTPAALFAVLHASTYSHPVYLLIPFSLACLLGIVRDRVRSIWPGAVLHSFWNLCMIAAAIGVFSQATPSSSNLAVLLMATVAAVLGVSMLTTHAT